MRFTGPGIVVGLTSNKGITKRSASDEAALRVRILKCRHVQDVYDRCIAEMGDRARELGPVDMSRNALRAFVRSRNKAHLTPPYVEALSPVLAGLIGDQSALVTIQRYAALGGRPMPSRQKTVASEVLGLTIGANFAGTLIGWSEKSRRPYLHAVPPDDLECEYASDDPLAPTIVKRRCMRRISDRDIECWDTWDLTDPENPTYRVYAEGADRTLETLGQRYEGPGYWWRYADGRPFIPLVVQGDPREPYLGLELADASLTVNAMWTHTKAGAFDAYYPSRHAIGLRLVGSTSNSNTGQTGTQTGPEIVHCWEHEDPERPGSLMQFGPGFDPEAMARFARAYETGLISALDLSIRIEGTGGEPAETEVRALREAAAWYYDGARGHDSLVLRRVTALCNRASEMTPGMTPFNLPEIAHNILYREEITEALASPGDESQLLVGQMTATLEVARAVGRGELDRAAGEAMVAKFMGISAEQASEMVGREMEHPDTGGADSKPDKGDGEE